jgi:CheY-like chemotaxis protein
MIKKIALIDDSAPFVLLIKQLLGMDSIYEVDSFNSADEFIRNMTKVVEYDLIIMDINMPGMDGLSAVKHLKNNITTESIPIMLLTGDARESTIKTGVLSGARDFIVKPIEPTLFLERVTLLLATKTSDPLKDKQAL